MKTKFLSVGIAALLAGSVGLACATPVTIQNGDFSHVTFGATTPAGTQASVINRISGQQRPNWVTVDGWQVSNNSHSQALWYADAHGALNGPGGPLLAAVTAPPSGSGSFVALNGDTGGGPDPDIQANIQQQLFGLTAGNRYVVHFAWAAAQQNGVHGATTDYLQVSLGGQSRNTTTLDIASHAFSGWQSMSFGFTADSDSPWLSFLAYGTPAGAPPMALLSNVSVSVPEPPELALFGLGLLGLGLLTMAARRRALRRREANADDGLA